MFALTGTKAPSGGVLMLADGGPAVAVPKGARLLLPADAEAIARYVAGTAAFYDAVTLCMRGAK
jgi:hypothetical protein